MLPLEAASTSNNIMATARITNTAASRCQLYLWLCMYSQPRPFLAFGDMIRHCYALYKNHRSSYVFPSIALALLFLATTASRIEALPEVKEKLLPFRPLMSFAKLYFQFVLLRISLHIYDGGSTAEGAIPSRTGDYMRYLRTYGAIVLILVLVSLPPLFVYMLLPLSSPAREIISGLLSIPALVLFVRIWPATALAVDCSFKVKDALYLSWHFTKGHFFSVAALTALVLTVTFAGALSVVGAFVAIPMASLVAVDMYRQLFNRYTDNDGGPQPGE